MAAVEELTSEFVSGFDTDKLDWIHLEGRTQSADLIDYWIAVLGARPEDGRIDFLAKWEPNAYCHYHRHVGQTTSIVLEGEHHIVEESATETIHKTRTVGHYACNPPGDVHMEYAGPEGSVLFFSMYAPDGNLFEVLDQDNNVLAVATIEKLIEGNLT